MVSVREIREMGRGRERTGRKSVPFDAGVPEKKRSSFVFPSPFCPPSLSRAVPDTHLAGHNGRDPSEETVESESVETFQDDVYYTTSQNEDHNIPYI